MNEKLIRDLAEKLGVASKDLFDILVAAAPIYSLAMVILLSFLFGVALFFFRLFRKELKKDRPDEILIPVLGFGGVVLFIGLLGGFLETLPKIFYGFFAPKLWAIDFIIHSLK